MNLLPIFVSLAGRPIVVVGAGRVAAEKIGTLIATGARLKVVAPAAVEEVSQLAAAGRIEWIKRCFEPRDLDGMALAVAATDDGTVNAAVHDEARRRGLLANSVDDIPNCDFFFASVVRRGALQVAISTEGKSPALAQRLRKEIDAALPEDVGAWLDELGTLRREVLANLPGSEERRQLLHTLAERPLCAAEDCPTRRWAREQYPVDETAESTDEVFGDVPDFSSELDAFPELQTEEATPGVALVGAGPGDPDLLTVKAVRLLQTADVILHDDLVTEAVLELASPSALVENVGKRCGTAHIAQEEIQRRMIGYARQGLSVVRLKSGDPLLFGRANEEMAALDAAGIGYQIVPGISSAFAAAASLGASLTDRTSADSVLIGAGHHAPNRAQHPTTTRIVYMPGRDLHPLAESWLAEGLPAELPCAIVSRASQAEEQVVWTTLSELATIPQVASPSLVLAGWTLQQARSHR